MRLKLKTKEQLLKEGWIEKNTEYYKKMEKRHATDCIVQEMYQFLGTERDFSLGFSNGMGLKNIRDSHPYHWDTSCFENLNIKLFNILYS